MDAERISPKPDKARGWKIALGVIGGIIALPFVIFGIISAISYPDYQKSAAAEPKVKAAADHFKVGKDWVLTSEGNHGPGAYCIDVRCPSVGRHWDIGLTAPTADDIRSLIKDSGYVLADNCKQIKPLDPLYLDRFNYSCTTTPVGDPSISVSFYITEPDFGVKNAPYTVSLFVERVNSSE